MYDEKGESALVTYVAKTVLLSISIYHNSGCYNSLLLKEHNVLVALHDRSQDASQIGTEMAN